MTTVLISVVFAVLLCGVALGANARFRDQDRLPMQWLLDGQVTWSAPRRIALAFIPAVSMPLLIGAGMLLGYAQPRPGQEGMVIPSIITVGLLMLAAQLFHLWMVAKTIRRNRG